jgi:phosphoglucan, water dikinase
VKLSVSAGFSSVQKVDEAAEEGASSNQTVSNKESARAEPVVLVSEITVLPLSAAEINSCGAKAAACSRLFALAAKGAGGAKANGAHPKASFQAPRGAVLPFGCMEAAVEAAGKSSAFVDLLQVIETAAIGPELDKACVDMQALLSAKCQPSSEVVARLQDEVRDARVVIARSSASVEDLAGLSGAGLYESVPNLDATNAAALAQGVADVWASLFSRRAVLSRRAAAIQQRDASMAVLVQVCKPSCSQ